MEWHAEAAFKQAASEAAGAMVIQKKSKKEIGDYLKKAIDLRSEEIELRGKNNTAESTNLQILMSDIWMNRSFAEAHGLWGLVQADVTQFQLSVDEVWQEPSAYACLQLGLADILHIMVARHLGCEYIASFDSDFGRVKDIVAKTGLRVLASPDEVLAVL